MCWCDPVWMFVAGVDVDETASPDAIAVFEMHGENPERRYATARMSMPPI